MSMIRCDNCNYPIDSDEDPKCFVEVGDMRAQTKDVVWCEACWDEKEREGYRPEPPGLQAFIDAHYAREAQLIAEGKCPVCEEEGCTDDHDPTE